MSSQVSPSPSKPKWFWILFLVARSGLLCIFRFTQVGRDFTSHICDSSFPSLFSSEARVAQGVVRDLRRVLVKDAPNAAEREHINLFLLVSENGELIPLAIDYDNSGLQNGDRVSVTYETDDRLHRLAEAENSDGKSSPYVAKYHRLLNFKLVTNATEGPGLPAEKEAK